MSPFADIPGCRRSLTSWIAPIADFDTMSSYADIRREEKHAHSNAADLGRSSRPPHKTRPRQKSLAQKVGVSRQWIVDVERGKRGPKSACCSAPSVRSASPSMQKKKVQETKDTACLTLRMHMSILIPSLPPHAGKENERRTGRHPRRPRNRPRLAGRQGKTILYIQ